MFISLGLKIYGVQKTGQRLALCTIYIERERERERERGRERKWERERVLSECSVSLFIICYEKAVAGTWDLVWLERRLILEMANNETEYLFNLRRTGGTDYSFAPCVKQNLKTGLLKTFEVKYGIYLYIVAWLLINFITG